MTATTIASTEATARKTRRAPTGRRTLRGAVVSELKRLNRWTFTGVGAALFAAFSMMATAIVFLAADQVSGSPMMAEVGDLTSSDGLVAGIAMAANLVGIVALSLWAAASASDYTTGWIRVMVQAEPRRWRLLFGKFAALVGLTLVGTLLATVVSVGSAPLLASATGVSTAAWGAGWLGTVASAWLNLSIAILVWGIIGFAVATVTRSVIVAIAGGIGYLLVFEGLLGLVAESATTYLPGTVLGAVVAGGNAALAYGTALALAGVYAAAALAVSVAVFHRRDVVS